MNLVKAVFFAGSLVREDVVDYVIELGLEFGIQFELMRNLEDVNTSNLKYVLTRGVPKKTLYEMKDKIWHNDLELSKLVDNKYETKEYLVSKGFASYLPRTYIASSPTFIE